MRHFRLDAKYQIGWGLMVLFATTQAHADGPPVRIWVDLKVVQCQAVNFEAPPYETQSFRQGDEYRTALVIGNVSSADVEPFDKSQWAKDWAERTRKALPRQGEELRFVLKRWDESLCRALVGNVQRFTYNHACDTLPRRGPCLPPHQLVEPTLR
jgi:hypothetical protein